MRLLRPFVALTEKNNKNRPLNIHASLWSRRKSLFFKPWAGFGSRGAYRGDKLTRRVFEDILRGGYVAQELVPPAERMPAEQGAPLKFDVRNYAYAGEVQLLAAYA